jgi:hypothetical protein
MTTVTDVLDRLASGETDTEQAAAEFAAMTWPTPPGRKTTLAQILADPDPEPAPPGSFAEVEQAMINGDITAEQYRQFVQAIQQH